MEVAEFNEIVRCGKFTAGINMRYHQHCEWWWGMVDKGIRIAVGVISVLGFWLGLKGQDYLGYSEAAAVASMLFAVALNVIPAVEREKFHSELFHKWSSLRASLEWLSSRMTIEGGTITPEIRSRLLEAIEDENDLHGSEPIAWRKLLTRCEADEIESIHGVGIRTHKAAEEAALRAVTSTTC